MNALVGGLIQRRHNTCSTLIDTNSSGSHRNNQRNQRIRLRGAGVFKRGPAKHMRATWGGTRARA